MFGTSAFGEYAFGELPRSGPPPVTLSVAKVSKYRTVVFAGGNHKIQFPGGTRTVVFKK